MQRINPQNNIELHNNVNGNQPVKIIGELFKFKIQSTFAEVRRYCYKSNVAWEVGNQCSLDCQEVLMPPWFVWLIKMNAAGQAPRILVLPPTPSDAAEDAEPVDSGICGQILTGLSWVVVICTMPFSLFVCFKVVQEYERAVIFRLGRLVHGGAKGPGIFFILPCIDNYARVDLRTRTYDVPPQEVLTKDSVTVSVDAVVYYRVSNATVSVANVANAHHSTRLLAQTTLRNVLGTRPLHEILSDREAISNTMQNSLDEATDAWGIKVERVEIKDVRLPVQLQRAMAAEAEAAREARAKVIAAEGEHKASRALREASEVIGDSPAALQLRYLQTLNTISAEKNSTIVFPLPIDLLTYFVRAKEAAA